MSAIRAATAGSRTLRSDVKDPRVFARDLFDAAARHRTELVHTPFYGVRCVTVQTPAPTGSIHAKGGRASGVEGSVRNPSTPGGRNGTETNSKTLYARVQGPSGSTSDGERQATGRHRDGAGC